MVLNSQQSIFLFSLLQEKLKSAIVPKDHQPGPKSSTSLLDCSHCEGFMVQPVCLPCGHSMCKSCVDKVNKLCGETCGRCKQPISSNSANYSPTIVLRTVVEKFFPKWVESGQYREAGNRHMSECDFHMSIEWFSKAITLGVKDHRVYGNRSKSYLAVNELQRALEDAQTACAMKPLEKKGHFIRACVLEKQDKWMEAIAAFLLCHYLSNSKDQPLVANLVCQLLDDHMSYFTHFESRLSSTAHPTSVLKVGKDGVAESSSLIPTVDSIVELAVDGLRIPRDHKASNSFVGLDISFFECCLCKRLMYEPVTITCGHSFCRTCIIRSFDHSQTCPMCRSWLHEIFQAYSCNSGVVNIDKTLHRMIVEHFPVQCREQKAQLELDSQHCIKVGTCETELLPIFVRTQTFPGILCPLHVFEPRYRLLIRRCMRNGSRRFGMCQPVIVNGNPAGFSDFGTVHYINSVQYTPDGRSLVKTIGERRFKVVGHDMVDGYHQARVKFVFDERVTEQSEIESLRRLQREVYASAKQWLDGLPFHIQSQLMQCACSPLPPMEQLPQVCPNGPTWLWWYVYTLPLSPQVKEEMFMCISLRDRLMRLRAALP